MSEPLSPAEIERMRAEHVAIDSGLDDGSSICASDSCWTMTVAEDGFYGDAMPTSYPCDAALLLAEMERRDAGLDSLPRVMTSEEVGVCQMTSEVQMALDRWNWNVWSDDRAFHAHWDAVHPMTPPRSWKEFIR